MTKTNANKFFKAGVAAAVVVSSGVVAAPIVSQAEETQNSISFKDLSTKNPYYTDIMNLAERGIIKGFPDKTFGTYKDITRGQAAKILAQVLHLDTENVTDPGFVDVKKDSEYYGAIAALQNAGIINGYTNDNTFRAGEFVTRNHMAKMIAIGFGFETNSTAPFTDMHDSYKEYISALFENGVTTGRTSTTFDGLSFVTRGQMAAFAVRAENVTKEITFTINDIEASKIVTSEGQFRSSLPIFNAANSAALEGAVVNAVITNGEVKAINALTLNNSGSEENPVVLDGGNTIIDGVLTVNADFTNLKNITVNEDVILTSTVANNFDANGLDIKGELVIVEEVQAQLASLTMFANLTSNGPKVNLTNSAVKAVNAKRDNVIISSNIKLPEVKVAANVTSIEVNANVATVTVNASEALQIKGSASIDKVNVQQATQLALEVTGLVKQLDLANAEAKVSLGTNISVEKIVVPTGSNISTLINDYETVKEKIVEVVDNSGAVVEPPVNNGGNQGGEGTPGENGNPGSGGTPGDEGNNGTPGNGGTPGDGGNNGTPGNDVTPTDIEKINATIASVTGNKVEELKFANVNENLVKDLAALLTEENVDLTPIGSLIADADGDDADETVSEAEFVAFFTSLNHDQVIAQYGAVLTADQKAVLAKLKEIYPSPVVKTDVEKINEVIASVTGNKVEELKFANVNENLVKDLAALLTKDNVNLTPIGSLIADADGDDAGETVSEAEFVAFFTSLNHDQVIAQYDAVLTADQKAVLAKLKEIYPSPVVKTDVEKINEVIASVTGNKVEELKFANVNENLVKDLAALLTKENVDLTPIGSLIADADGDDADETVSEVEFVAFFTSLNHDQVIAQYGAVLTADQKAVLAKLKEIYPSPVVKTDVEKINEVIASVTGNKVEELKFANVNENLVKDLAALLTKENVDLTPIGSLIADADGDDAGETVSEAEFVAFFTSLNHDQVIAQYGAVLTADQKAVLAKLKEIYPSPVVVKTDLEKINEVIADVTGDKVDELTFTNVDQNLVEDLANLLTKENVDLTPIGSLIADADGDDADETVSEVEFVAFFTNLNHDQVIAQYGAVLTTDQKAVLAKLKEIYPSPVVVKTDLEKINEVIASVTGDKVEELTFTNVDQNLVEDLANLLTKENVDLTPIGSLIADADGDDADETVSEVEFVAFFTNLNHDQVIAQYGAVLTADQKAVLAKLKEIYPSPVVVKTDLEKINEVIADVTGDKVDELTFTNVDQNLVEDLANLLTKENVDLTPIGSLIADADGDDADETVSEVEFVAFFTNLNHDQVIAQYGAVLTADQKAVLAKLKEIYPSPVVVKTDLEKINEVIADVTGDKVDELTFTNVDQNLVEDLANLLTKENVDLTPIGSLIADADGDDADETVSEVEFVAFFTSLNYDQVVAQYGAVLTDDQKDVLAKLKEIYPTPAQPVASTILNMDDTFTVENGVVKFI